MKISRDYYRGCLLGGAVGDAKGYGITQDGKHLISDNSQLAFFTVDGLLWADDKAKKRGIYAYIPCLFYAYQKWLYTQTGSFADKNYKFLMDSEILQWEELYARRGEGNTSLESLAESINGTFGSLKTRINNSKSCGAVMRSAPIGMYFCKDSKEAFKMGCDGAAITHGNPKGYLPGGVLAFLISDILKGESLVGAVLAALEELEHYHEYEEVYESIEKAVELSKSPEKPHDAMKKLGYGFIGNEALALAIYCALKYDDDFEQGILTATSYGGNTDSIAAICGNLLGAYLGSLEIPFPWVNRVELSELAVNGADKLLDTVS